jgi:hypothetical protein
VTTIFNGFSFIGFSDGNENFGLGFYINANRRDGESYRTTRSRYGPQGFLVGDDAKGNNIMTGDKDGYSPLAILEIF